MIVNVYSVLMLFMAGTGLLLAAVLAGASLWAAWQIRNSRGQQQTSAAERSVHLTTLLAAVCLVILIAGWPLLYAMLGSFVAEVPGAMCIYGVTRVMPLTAALVQAAKPAAIFALGAWLLLEHVRRRSGRPPRRWRGLTALAMVAGFVIFAHAAELYYVFNMNSLNEVSCCSRYASGRSAKLQAAAYYLPWEAAGPTVQTALSVLFFAGVPLLAFWLLAQSRRRKTRHKALSIAENAVLMAVAAGLGLASLSEFSQVLGPRLMRLPFHHCLYCLMMNRNVPEAPLMIANLAIGIFAAGWAAVVGAGLHAESWALPAQPVHRRLCLLGGATLLACVLMVVIHLAVAPG